MPKLTRSNHYFVICIANQNYEASLEKRKIYLAIKDEKALKKNLLRVVDESGEDYLYPLSLFFPIALPKDLKKAIDLAA